ncbi:MAG: photosystem II cytochrome PsbV2 [Cyanobacteriota bacterium]|nr:photosystem II cytochrome PsbV2 [Cyanobacteriota bacterium]
MLLRKTLPRFLFAILFAAIAFLGSSQSVIAANVDNYVRRYLDVSEPVEIKANEEGDTKLFSGDEISTGKNLFSQNCLNCHVGGANLPMPPVSLSLKNLQGATPPRDNIHNLVDFFREPMVYDGSDYSYFCRQITERWMPEAEVEKLAAFIIRAAEKAPGWGSDRFD